MTPKGFDRFMILAELAGNLKISRLSDREFRCLILGVWAVAAKADPRGYLAVAGTPATARDVAHQARLPLAVARATLSKLRELRMLEHHADVGFEYCHDWHELNPDPGSSTDRVRRHRAKQRNENETPSVTKPLHKALPEVEVEVEVLATQVTRKRATRPKIDQSTPPENFPDEHRETLGQVVPILRGVWEMRGGVEPQERGVGLAILRNPRADHLNLAHRLEHWLLAGRGQRARCADIAARFGDWVEGEHAELRVIDGGGKKSASDLLNAMWDKTEEVS